MDEWTGGLMDGWIIVSDGRNTVHVFFLLESCRDVIIDI